MKTRLEIFGFEIIDTMCNWYKLKRGNEYLEIDIDKCRFRYIDTGEDANGYISDILARAILDFIENKEYTD